MSDNDSQQSISRRRYSRILNLSMLSALLLIVSLLMNDNHYNIESDHISKGRYAETNNPHVNDQQDNSKVISDDEMFKKLKKRASSIFAAAQ